ncbi:hypothetical protein LNP24_19620 [Klebsiella pneumoniae subsp. pneumoniae]|nr:hypothetical protein [Klebsiella pneumoniae subsp. pneumoniae]
MWLASLPETECETVLQRITREQRTPYTVTDIASLMEKIAQVRRQGYATIEQEFEIGMLGAGGAVNRQGRDPGGGALSLTSHQSRTSLEALCRDHPRSALQRAGDAGGC